MLLEEQWQSIEMHHRYLKFISDNEILEELNNFMTKEPKIGYFEKIDI
ncbi:MAG: hypothetical protein ACJAUP_002047 [Cellvibrionaceae bacterium]|jgi:hypothetical protein